MTDVTHEISAVRRRVGSRTLQAGEARVAMIARTYDAPLEDVWEACTTPERIARWFLPVTGDLRLGGRYQLEGNAGGSVEACDPPRSFALTWEFGGATSWVTVRLEPEGEERTRFELEHVAQVGDDIWAQYGPGATGVGWDLGLLALGRHLPAGADVRAEAAEFEGSPEARAFIVGASEAWGEAAVAAGEDPEAARAAAARTTAFYTGAEQPEA